MTENNGSGQNDGTTSTKENKDAATSLSPSSSPSQPPAEAFAAAAAAATAEPPPPSPEDPQDEDECVLCCYLLPLKVDESQYKECCGELICDGCIIAQIRTLIIGSDVTKPIAGSKEEDLEFITIVSSKPIMVCPFCRGVTTNSKEFLKRLWKQIDDYNDPKTMNLIGSCYVIGTHGRSKKRKKAEELLQRA